MRGGLMTLAAVGTAAVVGTAVYRGAIRPWYRTWGVEPGDRERLLPGDELIGAPTGSDTRSITVGAPAAAIWPWLVQMGYGRAGWYSYDALDMRGRSSEAIVPEWQSIEVGAFMPASAGGGFEIAQVEPEHALVLYLDNEIVDRQARSAHETTAQVHGTERMPAGLAASTAILRTQPQRFRVTWAFVLEPIDGERTRLVERVRVEFPEMESWSRFSVPLVGFGVFVMTQRQMLGIKSRAERLVHPKVTQALDDTIVPAGPSELLPV